MFESRFNLDIQDYECVTRLSVIGSRLEVHAVRVMCDHTTGSCWTCSRGVTARVRAVQAKMLEECWICGLIQDKPTADCYEGMIGQRVARIADELIRPDDHAAKTASRWTYDRVSTSGVVDGALNRRDSRVR